MKGLINIDCLLTLSNSHLKGGRNILPEDLSLINDGAVIFDEEKIIWVGKTADIPNHYNNTSFINASGLTITPEIIDSHTHLVFGGDRSKEYCMRLNGASYEDIAKINGGINYTSKITGQLSSEDLFQLSQHRIEEIYQLGIGTIEIKSGYGLSYESEKRISLVIDRLKKHFYPRIQIINTFMAAHAIPSEFNNGKEYLDKVAIPLLHELSALKIIDFIDIFHEKGYFDDKDVTLLATEASKLSIPLRIHVDEFNDNNGALLGIELKATSLEHLLCINKDNISKLATSNTVATLLPGTAFFLGKPLPPARMLLDSGVKVALASDFNPGSCHFSNVIAIASLAAPSLKMNVAEVWCALCLNSAHSLGLHQGAIIPGLKPRFSFFNCNSHEMIFYSWGKNLALPSSSILEDS